MSSIRTLTRTDARRLFIAKQHLSDLRPRPSMFDVIKDIGCLQLDPISAVARSHLLVLHSRLGQYDPLEIDYLIYGERSLMEYWAHAASIVLTDHYPVHQYMMRRYPDGGSAWSKRLEKWVNDHPDMREHIMSHIREHGASFSRDIDYDAGKWGTEKGWSGSNHNRMIDYLWTTGDLMVALREGKQRAWDLSERLLPEWTPRDVWDDDKITRFSAQVAIKALGATDEKQIKKHYTRNRYPNLSQILPQLSQEGLLENVEIVHEDGGTLPGDWVIHTGDIPLLERIQAGEWAPRTALLSPFDNLICDRDRTEALFDFYFRLEIYVPKAKREYGYYVLPILHGDRLIGRIDPKFARKTRVLTINAVYAEDDAPDDPATVQAIGEAISNLGEFLGAEKIKLTRKIPAQWRGIREWVYGEVKTDNHDPKPT